MDFPITARVVPDIHPDAWGLIPEGTRVFGVHDTTWMYRGQSRRNNGTLFTPATVQGRFSPLEDRAMLFHYSSDDPLMAIKEALVPLQRHGVIPSRLWARLRLTELVTRRDLNTVGVDSLIADATPLGFGLTSLWGQAAWEAGAEGVVWSPTNSEHFGMCLFHDPVLGVNDSLFSSRGSVPLYAASHFGIVLEAAKSLGLKLGAYSND